LIAATNADRVSGGLEPLQFDPALLPIARQRANTQLGSQPLTHYDANGELILPQLLEEADVPYGQAGENLARAGNGTGVVRDVEQAPMKSPEHRGNILEPGFRRVAIGVATDPTTHQLDFAEEFRD
jgi:uncharacterized protein YkwD